LEEFGDGLEAFAWTSMQMKCSQTAARILGRGWVPECGFSTQKVPLPSTLVGIEDGVDVG